MKTAKPLPAPDATRGALCSGGSFPSAPTSAAVGRGREPTTCLEQAEGGPQIPHKLLSLLVAHRGSLLHALALQCWDKFA
jgi:hypothetical protein